MNTNAIWAAILIFLIVGAVLSLGDDERRPHERHVGDGYPAKVEYYCPWTGFELVERDGEKVCVREE